MVIKEYKRSENGQKIIDAMDKVHENLIHVNMDNHQRKIYDFIETKYVKAFEQNSSATAKDVLNKAKLIRLRQASINPSLLMKPLKDTLEINHSFWDRDPSANYINYDEFPDDSEIVKMIYNFENNLCEYIFKL